MEKKLVEMEEQFKKQKEEADLLFEQQRKDYESRLQALQKQIETQSIMSNSMMMTSAVGDEFGSGANLSDDDLFDKCDWTEQVRKKRVRHVGEGGSFGVIGIFMKRFNTWFMKKVGICSLSNLKRIKKA